MDQTKTTRPEDEQPGFTPDQQDNYSPYSEPQETQFQSSQPEPKSEPVQPYMQSDPVTQPVPEPQMSPQFIQQAEASPQTYPVAKKSKKGLIIGFVVATLFVLIGASAAVFAFVYNDPKNVVADGLFKLATSENVSMTGNYTMTEGGSSVKIDFDAYANKTQLSGNVDVTYNVAGKDTKIKAHYIGDSKTSYIKVDDARRHILDLSGMSEMDEDQARSFEEIFGDLMDKLDGKWVKITDEDLDSYSKLNNGPSVVTATCTEEQLRKISEDTGGTQEIKDLYTKYTFIIPESLGSETVDGVNSNHYKLKLDKRVLSDFLNGFLGTKLFSAVDDCSSDNLAEELKTTIGELKTDTSEFKTKMEIWINPWSHEVTKMSASEDDETTKSSLEIKPKTGVKNPIEVPTDVTTIKELTQAYEKVMSEMFNSDSPSYGLDDGFTANDSDI